VTADLFADLDDLPHRTRMSTLTARARGLSDADWAPVLAAVGSADVATRNLALTAALVAGHRPVIEAAIHGDDPALCVRAVGAWLAGAPDVWDLLEDAPATVRKNVYVVLRSARFHAIADQVVDRVRARYGDREAASVLPGCSPAVVSRLLPTLTHAIVSWYGLGLRHADAVIDDAERVLAATPVPDRETWWAWFGQGVWAAATVAPERVLDLLDRYAPPTSLPGYSLNGYGPLARFDPRRVLAMLSTPDRAAWILRQRLPRPILNVFATLEIDELAPLAVRLRSSSAFAQLLNALAPSRRERLYDAAYADTDTARRIVTDDVLHRLPHARRAAEARRMLALAEIRDDEQRTLHYTAYLPWDEAYEPLTRATRRALAEDRATGYELLIRCAARTRDRDTVATAVEYVVRIRNEQDPVRVRVLTELARTAARLLSAGSVEHLDQLVTDAVEARDSSPQTRSALSTLALNTLQARIDETALVAWSTRTLSRLFGDGRLPWLGDLTRRLRHGQEQEFYTAVREWIVAAIHRGDHGPLFAVARALHRRAGGIDDLQDLLKAAINHGNHTQVVRTAIELWLVPRETRDERVAAVMAFDTSAAAIPAVWRTISARRTDLLDLVLGDRAPTGMFLNEGPRWIPSHGERTDRWPDRYRRRHAELLDHVIADAGAVMHLRTSAIAAAARIPGYGWPVVSRRLGSPDTNLDEAAMGALVWTDRPDEALPILLSYVNGDRARVAAYAAGRAARFVRPGRLGPLLAAALPNARITSRKELLRLIAALGVPDAGQTLLAEWRRPGQHRDVRTAIVSAARQRPESAHAWDILAEATASGREDALAVLTASPYDIGAEDRPRYAALISACTATTDPVVAAAAWRKLTVWARWAGDVDARLLAGVTNIADRQVWRPAAEALIALVGAGDGTRALNDVLVRLIALDAADRDDDPEDDRPALRRIRHVTAALIRQADRAGSTADRSVLRGAAAILAGHDTTVPDSLALRLQATSPRDADLATDLAAIAEAAAPRRTVADRLRADLVQIVAGVPGLDPGHVIAAARTLAGTGERASGLFAVALATGGTAFGWPPPWRRLLMDLRRHPDPDVRDAAIDVETARP
jgi:hypothetical protein